MRSAVGIDNPAFVDFVESDDQEISEPLSTGSISESNGENGIILTPDKGLDFIYIYLF